MRVLVSLIEQNKQENKKTTKISHQIVICEFYAQTRYEVVYCSIEL